MHPFDYVRATTPADAIASACRPAVRYLGGGTNLVDLMREDIERPATVVDVSGLASVIHEGDDGSLVIGAATRNTAVAEHPLVRIRYPVLSRAILAGASAQIRNMATVGGNLLQRTRCHYFYDLASRCNKRTPGAGCDAVGGFNRMHAVLGASAACVATHPSDLCVALATLDAVVLVEGHQGTRRIPFADFHRLPGDSPQHDTILDEGDLVTAVELPPPVDGYRSAYRKVRDRSSYAFALVSVAALLDVRDGKVAGVRIAFGGVAHKPWRAQRAEAALLGQPANSAAFDAAANAELAEARPLRDNAFKIELARRTLTAVLEELAA
jgi:xanthine dehydrogenase YagS FAD-binding subunit